MADPIAQFEGESFQGYSTRKIEIEGTESGVIIIAVTTKWGIDSSDRSCIAITPEELARCNGIINDDDYRKPEVTKPDSATLKALADAESLLGGQ